jgi:putative oxidoreductase
MESLRRYGVIIGRVLIAVLFLHEAWFKLTHLTLTLAYMAQYGLPALLLPGALAAELFGGLALVSGIGVRFAEPALALFCASTALIFHMNWADPNQLLHFEKDFALAGALLVIAMQERHGARRTIASGFNLSVPEQGV